MRRRRAASLQFAVPPVGSQAAVPVARNPPVAVACAGGPVMLYSAMANSYPTIIPGLRSPGEQVKGIVHFGRMLDKIRLAATGKLPPDWEASRGAKSPISFDSLCCKFLQIHYAALEAETLKGGRSDEQLLDWACQHGHQPSPEEIGVWNEYMTKRGWRDSATPRLQARLAEIGLAPGTVQTMFEFIDLEEGRGPA